MKTKLHELTVSEFVTVLNGDHSPLLSDGETASEQTLAKVVTDLVHEYREIADPAGAKSYLIRAEDLNKEKTRVMFYGICVFFADLGDFERLRDILKDSGIDVGGMSDQRLKAEMKSRLARAKSQLAKIDEETPGEASSDIRRDFDRQAASLMAYFKFQIDLDTMKASVFAHLIAQFQAEVKAKMAAMKKK